MIQDAINHFTGSSLDRLAQESLMARSQLDLKIRETAGFHQLGHPKVDVKHLLSDLQYRFSGRQHDTETLIEQEVKSRTEDLYRKAHFDLLTHLPNRAHFQELMEQVMHRASENNTSFTLLFLDLDGFKKVNDTMGHHVGDDLLRHVGARLVSSLREDDIVGRFGGDEFVVLLTDSDDERETIERICQRIIDEVSRFYFFDGSEVRISTSIGVSRFPEDGRIASELSENADKALYVAKHQGKKQFRFYHDAMEVQPAPAKKIDVALEQAIDKNEIFTRVQPQIDLKRNQIVGGCLTAFWQSAHFKHISKSDWFELLQTTSWAKSAALWMIDSGCYYLKQWQQKNSEFVVTVPVMKALWQENLIHLLDCHLEKYGVSKAQLQLSFSLRALNDMDDSLLYQLKSLGNAGYQLTFTDLGASPLDLNFLSELQVQELKFDRDWLKQQMKSKNGRQWVNAIIQMAISLDASIIATGIETDEELDQLRAWGCTYGQGPYWSECLPSHQFEQLLG